MVVVQCYHCSKILELDEGFRGGVCRCSQCGSLLQVPKATAASGAKARPAAPGGGGVDRPASPTADPGISKGQFDPRSGIGSGLGSGRARPQKPEAPPGTGAFAGTGTGAFAGSGGFAPSPTQPAGPRKIEKVAPVEPAPGMPAAATHARQERRGRMILIISIATIVILLGVGVWAILALVGSMQAPGGKSAATVPAAQTGGGGETPKTAAVNTPPRTTGGFYGIKLTGRKIVISVDSGGSMRDVYDHVRKSFDEALKQLDENQEVRVVIWQSPPMIVPDDGWARKSERARFKPFEDSYAAASGQDIKENMLASLKLQADQTIFVTAKIDFPFDLAETVAKARQGGGKIDTLWVSSSDDETPLKTIAESSGGTHTRMSASDIAEYYR